MKYRFIILLTGLITIVGQPQSIDSNDRATRLIVKFKITSGIFKSLRQKSPLDYNDVISKEKVNKSSQVFDFIEQLKIQSIKPAKLSNNLAALAGGIERIFFLDFQDEISLELAYNKLKNNGDFEYVEYDFAGKGGGERAAQIIPNDPGFNSQWGLRNTGQTISSVPGKPGADINMVNAWSLTTGNPETKIAILDTGIPLTAGEFSGRLLPGYDFANNDNNPTDDFGHGTNVASVAAAKGNNLSGIAGVNWNCKIIPIKILNSNNTGLYSWWISALIMAADSGAKVINMSVGGSSFSQGLSDAVSYAYNKGAIIVACMMNENNEVTYYPAGFNNVISVGALNNLDVRVVPFCWGGGSNFGSHIDFMAPGDWILGLNYLNPNQTDYWCGTSQATPMVTGVISLMLGMNPALTFEQIYGILKSTAKDQVGNPAEDKPGWDKYYGWGRIDAFAALSNAVTPVELTSFTATANKNSVSLNWLTATETNSSGFEIERQSGNSNWEKIAFVKGNGTTTESKSYIYTDENLFSNNYSYRLKQIDFDGSFQYSNIVDVQILNPGKFELSQNYPNPFNPTTTISYSIPSSNIVTLKVYDVLGNEVATLVNEEKPIGNYEINFNAIGLSSGIYFYRIQSGDFTDIKKFILMK